MTLLVLFAIGSRRIQILDTVLEYIIIEHVLSQSLQALRSHLIIVEDRRGRRLREELEFVFWDYYCHFGAVWDLLMTLLLRLPDGSRRIQKENANLNYIIIKHFFTLLRSPFLRTFKT